MAKGRKKRRSKSKRVGRGAESAMRDALPAQAYSHMKGKRLTYK